MAEVIKTIGKSSLPALTEKDFLRQIKDLAKICHWRVYHPFLSKWSERGYPDITLVRPPRLIFAELKAEKGVLSESQCEWAELLQACPGVEYYCWKPSDFDAIVEILKR
jgi:hypothetical protein